jgi:hypothetical protein
MKLRGFRFLLPVSCAELYAGCATPLLHGSFAKRPNVVTVKELLGHSTVVVTMRYAHTNDDAKAEA